MRLIFNIQDIAITDIMEDMVIMEILKRKRYENKVLFGKSKGIDSA